MRITRLRSALRAGPISAPTATFAKVSVQPLQLSHPAGTSQPIAIQQQQHQQQSSDLVSVLNKLDNNNMFAQPIRRIIPTVRNIAAATRAYNSSSRAGSAGQPKVPVRAEVKVTKMVQQEVTIQEIALKSLYALHMPLYFEAPAVEPEQMDPWAIGVPFHAPPPPAPESVMEALSVKRQRKLKMKKHKYKKLMKKTRNLRRRIERQKN